MVILARSLDLINEVVGNFMQEMDGEISKIVEVHSYIAEYICSVEILSEL